MPDPGPGRPARPCSTSCSPHALRQWLAENPASNPPDITDAAISTALREIHAAPQRPWTVELLSEVAGMSRSRFAERFTALVGQPPMAYVTGWRLACGARLRRETDAPLATIV